MANFNTHLTVGAVVSGVAALNLVLVDVVPEQRVMQYFLIGVIGSILPDIDADNSVPFRIAFNVIGVLISFWFVFELAAMGLSLVELVVLALVAFGVIRFGLCALFARYTVHRGIIHSVPVALLCALLTVLLFYYLLERGPASAWIAGIFLLLGFITHLLLDEIYSVDVMGRRLKRSFGTAMKFASLKSPITSGLIYLAVAVAYRLAPSPRPLLHQVRDGHYHAWSERLWPSQEGLYQQLLASVKSLF